MTIPRFIALKTHVRKHLDACVAEATALFGEHGGDLTDQEHKLLATASDIVARQLLFRYARENGMRLARVRGQA